MDKVVVTKSKLDSLAQHINTKAGTTGAKTIAQMQATVDGIKVGGELQTKTVTGNGTYTPDEGYDGFSQFEVAVSNLLAENIRRCANVGGVEGAYFQPEIWVFNEKITFPGTTSGAATEEFRYTGLSFLSPALFALTENFIIGNLPNLAIGHTLRISYVKAKNSCRIQAIGKTVAYMDIDVSIPAGDSATGIIKRLPNPPGGFFDETTGWWGKAKNGYPNQIGRVIVFLKAPEGDFLTWLQANATKCQSIDRDFISRDYQNTTSPFADDPLFQLIESVSAKKTITKNGMYTIHPAAPYAAMYSAAVNVNVPVPAVQDTKAVTITSNGTVSVTPDAPYDALKKVDVTVDVASGGGDGAGFKVTFPATATAWENINAGAIIQADGTSVSINDYSTLAGKTIPNVIEICICGLGYYYPCMTVQTGKIMITYVSPSSVLTSTAVDGESTEVYMSDGSTSRWIPLADTVISAIEMYNAG